MFVSKFVSKSVLAAGLVLCFAAQAKATPDSFFDIWLDLTVDGDLDFSSTSSTLYSSIDTEMVSLSLRSSSNPNAVLTENPDGSFRIDSFFDIDYAIQISGGTTTVDSFFDVFTEVSFSAGRDNPDGSRTFDTEILSMDLTGATGPSGPNHLQLSPTLDHRGHVTVLKSQGPGGGDVWNVDSFFDVWTEMSLDSGGSYAAADAATPLSFQTVVPEPSTGALLALGLSVVAARRRRQA